MKPKFLNVDLEVVTNIDPAPLATALGGKMLGHYCGRAGRGYLAAFSLHSVQTDLGRTVRGICKLLETLPAPAARIWKRARCRTLDIGLMSGEEHPALALGIDFKTLSRVTALGATIAITLYPIEPNCDETR